MIGDIPVLCSFVAYLDLPDARGQNYQNTVQKQLLHPRKAVATLAHEMVPALILLAVMPKPLALL